jgi:serine/threonine protein kinase
MQGKYTILRTLGRGGMGALHLAEVTIANHQRLVVVKEMLDYYEPNNPLSKARAQHRFETEADILGSLSIPGVPQVFDYFSEGGRNYIVMQFIEGQNLETHLTHVDDKGNEVKGRAYPIEQVRSWGIEVCRILKALEEQKIVHMDIKPANLIQDKTGNIWLVDFGTVKTHPFNSPVSQVSMKKASVYGTLGYAPPEQTKGKAEPRSDVYALAATLYHLITDDDPSNHPGAFAQIARLPDDIAQALRQALTIDVRKRPNAAEFGRLLALPASGVLPFRWRDGATVRQPKDLVAIADQHWEEARSYFTGGDWENWLRSIHQNNLVAAIQTIRSQQPNPDRALDQFLRVLDPKFPAPRLHLAQPLLDASVMPWKTSREISFLLENHGSGCLQGQIAASSPSLRPDPLEFVTHDSCQIRLTIDSGMLSPSSLPQILYLKIDAGAGGQANLPVKLTVPEPELVLEGAELDFGPAYRGEEMAHKFQVSNAGDSAFLGEVRSNAPWLKVNPEFFDCSPGASKELLVQINTRSLPHAPHAARVQVWARAGKWDQTAPLQVRVEVSPWRTFVKHWLPPMLLITFVAAYGGFLGSILGTWFGALHYPIQNVSIGMLLGALFGAVICAIPPAFIGGLGGLSNLKGKQGLRLGAEYGAVAGVVSGGIAGLLTFPFLSWLGLLGSSETLDFFGGIVGALSGMALGAGLYYFSRKTS